MITTPTEASSRDPARTGATALTVAVIGLFFLWGGITSLNDILIPKLKSLFVLSYAQAMLVQFAFFTAYALISVPAGNWIARLGYGRGIVLGLAIMAAGCLLFLPATAFAAFGAFLLALFVLAAGITVLQVAANPLIARLGDPATAHSRLTFAQAFNSLGTTLFPLLGAQLMLRGEVAEVHTLESSYGGIAALLLALCVGFWLVRDRLGRGRSDIEFAGSAALLREPRLAWGVVTMFLYVGAEVAIGSVLVNYLIQLHGVGVDVHDAGSFVSIYWGGAMVGRFLGAGLLRLFRPGLVLACAALGAAALAAFAAFGDGMPAAVAVLAIGLMNSIMFPTIFALAVEGLGERTPQGSGLICMAIVGGAIVPVAAGALADATRLSLGLLLPVACYLGIAAYGRFTSRQS
ncbi:MAG: sugar MFS transporter [Pelomonas sp.]|nr:sugar MFS transporter [Roseateles sp.]